MKTEKMMSGIACWIIGWFIGFWIGVILQGNSAQHRLINDCSFTGSHTVDNYIVVCSVKEVSLAKETKTPQ